MEELDGRIRRLQLDGFVSGWTDPITPTVASVPSTPPPGVAGAGRWRKWASMQRGDMAEASAMGVLKEVWLRRAFHSASIPCKI